MAKYAILIYEDEAGYAAGGAELYGEVMQAHGAFSEKAGAAIVGGEALQPTSTATSLRTDGAGEVTVTDGAFAETKEALGGFYLIEAERPGRRRSRSPRRCPRPSAGSRCAR